MPYLNVGVVTLEIRLVIATVLRIPNALRRPPVSEDDIVSRGKSRVGVRLRVRSLPYDLIAEVARVKDSVHYDAKVWASGRVAVEVEGASRFQDTAQLNKANCHHRQISSHIVMAQTINKRSEDATHVGRAFRHHFFICWCRPFPVPRVLKGFDLGLTARTDSLL